MEQARDVVGAGARAMIERGLALGGRSGSTPERLGRLFVISSPLRRKPRGRDEVFTGVVEPSTAPGRRHRLAVCTNKMEEHSVRLLEALGVADRSTPSGTRHLRLREARRAAPDATVERAGGDPRRAIMVGNCRTDIDTARAAGLPVIAVDFGYTDVPVAALGPDRTIDHFDACSTPCGRRPRLAGVASGRRPGRAPAFSGSWASLGLARPARQAWPRPAGPSNSTATGPAF